MYKGLQSFYKTTAVICTHAPKTLLLERLDAAALLLFYNLRGNLCEAERTPLSTIVTLWDW